MSLMIPVPFRNYVRRVLSRGPLVQSGIRGRFSLTGGMGSIQSRSVATRRPADGSGRGLIPSQLAARGLSWRAVPGWRLGSGFPVGMAGHWPGRMRGAAVFLRLVVEAGLWRVLD